jgi:hypothetical protein
MGRRHSINMFNVREVIAYFSIASTSLNFSDGLMLPHPKNGRKNCWILWNIKLKISLIKNCNLFTGCAREGESKYLWRVCVFFFLLRSSVCKTVFYNLKVCRFRPFTNRVTTVEQPHKISSLLEAVITVWFSSKVCVNTRTQNWMYWEAHWCIYVGVFGDR